MTPDERTAFVAEKESELRAAVEHVEQKSQPDRWDWLNVHVAINDLAWAEAPIPLDLMERLQALGYRL